LEEALEDALEEAFREMNREYQGERGKVQQAPSPMSMTFTTQAQTPQCPFLEERATTEYMMEPAKSAGVNATMMDIESFDNPDLLQSFLQLSVSVSESGKTNTTASKNVQIWKLYPDDWLVQEPWE
jgi:glutathionylspermidine synthase